MTSIQQPRRLSEALESFSLTETQVRQVLQLALSRGGELSELFFEYTDSTRIVRDGGKIDRIVEGTDRGVGLRILYDGRSLYGYTTDLTESALMGLAQTLSAAVTSKVATRTSIPEWQSSRQASDDIRTYQITRSPREVSIPDKVALLARAEKGAKEVYEKPEQITAFLLDSLRRTLVVNSDGLYAWNSKTYLHLVTQVVGRKGERVESANESNGGWVGMEFFDENPPEDFGRKAAKRVLTLLDARAAPSGTLPVVISSEAGGTMIHEAVGHGLEADLACNNLSVYAGKVGQQVASPLITVIDDGTMTAKRGSYVFDDEGNPSRKTTLIENGQLKGYLVDRLSAMKFDLMATGNGRRESFRHKPIVRMTNTYIAPGKDDPAAIVRDTDRGVFVKGMGGGQVNTVTGDFVFAITEGYLIENGKITHPIRGATLVGNGPKVLSIVDRVGNDLGFSTGTCGKDGQGAPVTDAQPTLRIPAMTVGGEVPIDDAFSVDG